MNQENSNTNAKSVRYKAPTPLTRQWVRYLVGLSVGVGVGVAGYLGQLEVPLFAPLVSLIPASIQDIVIPLSSALMSIVAVIAQWYGKDRLKPQEARKLFKITLTFLTIFFVALVVTHTLVVVRVPVLGGQEIARFVVGFTRPDRYPCTHDMSDAECIKHITLNESEIESFWGDGRIRLAKLALIVSYLTVMGSFGMLVALVLLRGQVKRT